MHGTRECERQGWPYTGPPGGDFLLNLRAVLLPTGTVSHRASGGFGLNSPLVGKPHPPQGGDLSPAFYCSYIHHVLLYEVRSLFLSPLFVPAQYKVLDRTS